MAFDESLAARVRKILSLRKDVEEKKMFGGLTFMVGGHMCCGVNREELVVRVGKDRAANANNGPSVRYCDFTGKPMKTMLSIKPEGLVSNEALINWIDMAVEFTTTQPPKI